MIEMRNVTKIYEENLYALDNVSLCFNEGEVIVLKGVSGSGKSTILSLIAGIVKPTSGEVIIDNKKISKLPDHFVSDFRRKNIGIVFQRYNLIGDMSAGENILLPCYPDKPEREQLKASLSLVLEQFHIEQKEHTLVKNLSGGQQQRVAIARAMINNPKIFLADEPTANLDEALSLEFIEILKQLKSQNRTIIVATHDPLFFNLDFVDRYITLEYGKILL
jgi:putative ABC transport system ATP-binding protein